MAVSADKKAEVEAAAEEKEVGAGAEDDQSDIFYVAEKALGALKEKLQKKGEVTQPEVNELAFPENLADDAVMVPVDMRGVGEEFDDVEQMIDKLGAQGAAEAFVKAREYFEANKDKQPEEDRPKPMTAKEWQKVLEDDLDDEENEGEEDELGMEDDEEEEEDILDEEGGDELDEDEGEPAAKKAKKDE